MHIYQLFSKTLVSVTAFASIYATLWGLTKGIGALKAWIVSKYRAYKKRKREKNELVPNIMEKLKEIGQEISSVKEDLEEIRSNLDSNNESTSTVMLEKMMWAYHYYVLQKNPIPLDIQTALVVMFKQYKGSNPNHNHIPIDFQDKIMACEVY